MVKYNVSSTSITIKLVGEDNFIDELAQVIRKNFNLAESFIDWIYSSDGNSVTVPLTEEKSPVTEMYPFLGKESLKSYYDRYMHSSASVLVLLGPPGTGKTSFVRGLLQHTKTSAVVTYDPELLEKDYVFAKFIEGNNNVMVIEDADNFLGARRDGNTVMHKFLNVGDGLVTTRNKKLIFSTNLPSVKEIDSALVRPGRCFDTLFFTYLNKQQALKLANVMNLKLESDKTSYSIADIFHVQEHKIIERRMGFL
jgi:SpoVK/Ycf46/Vps4 family AAA+-type ATPase